MATKDAKLNELLRSTTEDRIIMKALLAVMTLAGVLGAAVPPRASVFIEPTDGFDVYFPKAIDAKKVPVKVVNRREDADFVVTITSRVVEDGGGGHFSYYSTIKVTDKDGTVAFSDATHMNNPHGFKPVAEDLCGFRGKANGIPG